MKIDDTTTFGEMRIGDVFPNGDKITGLAKTDNTVSFTLDRGYTDHKGRPVPGTLSHQWAHETYGYAVDRGKFMSSLVDHS